MVWIDLDDLFHPNLSGYNFVSDLEKPPMFKIHQLLVGMYGREIQMRNRETLWIKEGPDNLKKALNLHEKKKKDFCDSGMQKRYL